MLEQYFVKPKTIDRIRGSWIAAEIEGYLVWLVEQDYSTKSIWRRVPVAFAFGEFARGRGASAVGELPAHVEAFVADAVARHDARTGSTRADGEGGPRPGRAVALGRAHRVRAHRPAAPRATLRCGRPRVLRLPG